MNLLGKFFIKAKHTCRKHANPHFQNDLFPEGTLVTLRNLFTKQDLFTCPSGASLLFLARQCAPKFPQLFGPQMLKTGLPKAAICLTAAYLLIMINKGVL